VALKGWAEWRSATLSAATDPRGDAQTPAAETGGDLTAGAVAYRGDGDDLLVRLSVATLPWLYPSASLNRGAGASPVAYGLSFIAGGVRREARGAAISWGTPLFELYRCDPVCVRQAELTGGYGTGGHEIVIAVPRSELPASARELTSLVGFASLTGGSDASRLDEVALPDAAVPAPSIAAGIAPAGTPRQDVELTPISREAATGRFAGTLSTASLPPGLYDVWAEACLGSACGAKSVPLRLGPPPSTLLLTERSARSGQFSDQVVVEASLTGEGGEPLAGAPVEFELAGAQDVGRTSATTDDQGSPAPP
jgi:hypothetical protein